MGTIQNNVIYNNRSLIDSQISRSSTPSYSNIQDWTQGGEGNISQDPRFVDPENGDFHLLPDSPCIDAGKFIEDLLYDIEGNQRGFNGTNEIRGDGSDYDIGAYEFFIRRNSVRDWNLYK